MELQKRNSNGALEEESVRSLQITLWLLNGAPQSQNLRFLRIGVPFFEFRDMINGAPFLLSSLYFFLLGRSDVHSQETKGCPTVVMRT